MILKSIYTAYKKDKTPPQYVEMYDDSNKIKIIVARRRDDVVYAEHINKDLYLCVRIERATVDKRTNNPMEMAKGNIRKEHFSGCNIQLIKKNIPYFRDVDNPHLAYDKLKQMHCWNTQNATRKRPVRGIRSLKYEVENYRE